MKALRLDAPRQFSYFETEDNATPGPGEALVRTHSVGVCGTDISCYLGKFPFFSFPRIPGHELGVEVLAVGARVSNVQPGDHCCVEPYINAPESFASRRGLGNCCQELQVLGVHIDGGLRDQFLIRADKIHPSAKLSYEQLALVETLAIGRHAVNRAGPSAGEHLLIIGAGPIGLATLEFARLAESRITVMDINTDRLEFCRVVYGVTDLIQVRGDGSELEQMRQVTSGELYPVVIEATGNGQSMGNALNYLTHGGTLTFVGITQQEITFPHRVMHAREMTLKSSRNALPEDFRRIIRLIEQGRIDTRPWITHRTQFSKLADVFESYTRQETGVIKAIVSMEAS